MSNLARNHGQTNPSKTSRVAVKEIKGSGTSTAAPVELTKMPVHPTTFPNSPVVTPLLPGQGWKITYMGKNGSTNDLTLRPEAVWQAIQEETAIAEAIYAKKPEVRFYTVVGHILNVLISIAIIVVMTLTILQYLNSRSVRGAWPTNPNTTPTYVMLGMSSISLLADAISLLFVCCSPNAKANARKIAGWVRTGTGGVSTVVMAGGTGLMYASKNGVDLWGWSCTDAADVMQDVNASSTLCQGNTTAAAMGIATTVLHVLQGAIVLYGLWKPGGRKVTGSVDEAKLLIGAQRRFAQEEAIAV